MNYTDIRVHRAPEFDKYDYMPAMKILVEQHEWWLECSRCRKHVTHEEDGRKWIDDDTVLCSLCVTQKAETDKTATGE